MVSLPMNGTALLVEQGLEVGDGLADDAVDADVWLDAGSRQLVRRARVEVRQVVVIALSPVQRIVVVVYED